ncbi:MAG: hypothetical protein R2723_04725 [Microbacterium sp.]
MTGGQVADTSMFTDVLDEIHVSGRGRANETDRVLADKGYPSKKNWPGWARVSGDQVHDPQRADQIAKLAQETGRPIDFGDEQKERQVVATSSSGASASSSSGAGSRPDTTRRPVHTQPGSASPQPCNGFSNTA